MGLVFLSARWLTVSDDGYQPVEKVRYPL